MDDLLCPSPTAEQRAIADYLDTETARIDALIAKKRRMIALLWTRLGYHGPQFYSIFFYRTFGSQCCCTKASIMLAAVGGAFSTMDWSSFSKNEWRLKLVFAS